MKKICSLALILSLIFAMTACGHTIQKETDTVGTAETSPVTEITESAQESEAVTDAESGATDIEEEPV